MALNENKTTSQGKVHGRTIEAVIADTSVVYDGAITAVNASGLALPIDDSTAGMKYLGVAIRGGTGVTAANVRCVVERRGTRRFKTTTSTANWIGELAYAIDDEEVTITPPSLTGGEDHVVGRFIKRISASIMEVDLEDRIGDFPIDLSKAGGAIAVNQVLFGHGTSASPATTALANKKFIELWCSSSASSGDNRLLYLQYFLTGGGGGECIRGLTTLTAATGTAHGAHVGLQLTGSGQISGLGVGMRATLMVPDKTLGGTVAAIMAELFADGTSSDVSNGTCLRCVLAGDSTGVSALSLTTTLLNIDGITIGSAGAGQMVNAISGDKAVTHLVKIKINGVTYWLMARNAV